MNNPYLRDITERMELVGKKASSTFGFLSEAQLNWRDSMESWSIAQYLFYIMEVNKAYLPTLYQLNLGTRKSKKREMLPILPDLWGTVLKRMLKADPKGQPKPIEGLNPPYHDMPIELVEEFKEHQESLISLFLDLDKEDHDAVVITSPVKSYVTYPVKDIIKAICLQEERHLKLAIQVLEHPAFPRTRV
ncbi:MAG: DinB family protein [Bacteroidota bacterium]